MTPIWYNRKFWGIVAQVSAVFIAVAIALLLWTNLTDNLQRLGIQLGFDFLNSQASFDIGETPIAYQASDPYRQALLVGLVNSLRVIFFGIILATVIGIIVGIARLSDNWLVRKLALIYVEILRNTPLLLQLFFWYFVVFLSLPKAENSISLFGLIQISNRGTLLPFGIHFSPELSTLTLGLTLYTGAFIAEIIRAGIISVPKGQWEAARALGLKSGLVLRLVIFPQALRLIIPPLTSQYLNLAKNSSLAIAIGYPDIYFVASTTFNQTGRAVEVILLIMITYLTISLIISLMMNLFNRSVQLKER
ncbi:ABC transporter permease subunit [Aetokthonos hydrillicola Thurmond2011]|jgi:general L-amino acid transport system permease protein|uniref:ABC transporter permease subunit n=1 Tax=Aetokthonos hydrillicola Thurmond2011 TaxID=2712845 RepID=A0AAP5IDC0_9CYAN|nr:ABC transporter permease subunit [Aetokthonos hydrillicola]MBO3459727.1 ABC transporter permease subunit [Aetokthonos hydrillicola CCALA 1050]MBW4585159.1 ABC transporter permease subunit [Aetokthonos hydrillicola CCALA 1050]MDR9899498.1 ABC transporter permease subunit [Aetokthonos hydrillicola Thurmond2011]